MPADTVKIQRSKQRVVASDGAQYSVTVTLNTASKSGADALEAYAEKLADGEYQGSQAHLDQLSDTGATGNVVAMAAAAAD